MVLQPRIVVVTFSIDEWMCMLLVEIQTHAPPTVATREFSRFLERPLKVQNLHRFAAFKASSMCFSYVVSMSPNSVLECNPIQCKYLKESSCTAPALRENFGSGAGKRVIQ